MARRTCSPAGPARLFFTAMFAFVLLGVAVSLAAPAWAQAVTPYRDGTNTPYCDPSDESPGYTDIRCNTTTDNASVYFGGNATTLTFAFIMEVDPRTALQQAPLDSTTWVVQLWVNSVHTATVGVDGKLVADADYVYGKCFGDPTLHYNKLFSAAVTEGSASVVAEPGGQGFYRLTFSVPLSALATCGITASTPVSLAYGTSAAANLDVINKDSFEGMPGPAVALTGTTLVLSKTDGPDPAAAGGQIVYTLAFTNTGTEDATTVVLTDTVPPNTTFASATGGGTHAAGVVTWNLGTLAAGASGSVTMTVNVASGLPSGTVISNTATVTAGNAPSVSASATTTVTSTPNMVLVKTDAPDPVEPGGQIVYTLSYENTGNGPATNVVITDSVPGNTAFVSATAGGTHAAGVVTWNVGTVPAGASGSVSFTVTVGAVPGGTVIPNTAQLTHDSGQTSDSVISTVATAAALTITKSDAPDPVTAGSQITYTIAYANTGYATATGVTITDVVPASTTFVSATGGGVYNAGTNTVTWSIGDVPAGTQGSVTLTVQVVSPLANGTVLANTATIGASNAASAAASSSTTVSSTPALTLAKTASPDPVQAGATLVYTLTYANTGNTDATGVVIIDTLPDDVAFVSATGGGVYSAGTHSVTWNVGTVGGGTGGAVSVTVTVASPLPDGTRLANAASVDSNETAPVATTAETVVYSGAAFALSKQAAPAPVDAGGTLTFTITYTNIGGASATGVVITDVVPVGTSFVSASAPGVHNAGTVTWNIGTVAAGAGGSVTLVVLVDALPAGAQIANSATVTSNETQPVSAASQSTVAAESDLTLVKQASANPVTAGAPLTYTLTYGNSGAASAHDVVLEDVLPAGTTFVSATGGGVFNPATRTVTWNVGTVASGGGGSVELVVLTSTSLRNGAAMVNVATASGSDAQPVTATAAVAVSNPYAKYAATGAFYFKKKGVADDTAGIFVEYGLVPGQTVSPVTENVQIELSNPVCGGVFSRLSIPPGAFTQRGAKGPAYFRGNVVDGITGVTVNVSVRNTPLSGLTDGPNYRLNIDLKKGKFVCLEGTDHRKIKTTIVIGTDQIEAEACFQRISKGDLYWPPTTAITCN